MYLRDAFARLDYAASDSRNVELLDWSVCVNWARFLKNDCIQPVWEHGTPSHSLSSL